MTQGYGKYVIPKWLIPLIILAVLTVTFGDPILKGLNGITPFITAQDETKKVDETFVFKDYGQEINVKGSNLLPPGSITNVVDLNNKVTKKPGTSYIQDNDAMSIFSVSAKKEDIENLKAEIGKFTISFKVKSDANNINIYPDLSEVPKETKRISFASSLFSNMKPAPDSYVANTNIYVENLVKDDDIRPVTYSRDVWDKSKTIYIRVFVYKK